MSEVLLPRKSKIILSTPGVGKTYLGKKYPEQILDMDPMPFLSSNFGEHETQRDFEKAKSTDATNPDFPYNYVDAILKQVNHYDLILITTLLTQACKRQDFPLDFAEEKLRYQIALPRKSGLDIIFKRLRERGNNEKFVKDFEKLYPLIIERFGNTLGGLTIEDGEYLEDTLLRHKVFTPKKEIASNNLASN